MKKREILLAAVLAALLCLAACTPGNPTATENPTESTLAPTEEASEDVTEAPTEPPISGGWEEVDGKRCYLLEDGTPAAGWLELAEGRYYLNIDGSPFTGWLEESGKKYYLQEDGTAAAGWLLLDKKQYYFQEDGSAATGKTLIEEIPHYFSPQGEYVVLVNPWTPVPDTFAANLLPLDSGFFVEWTCYDALNRMLADCEEAGFKPYVCSAYRTQAEQEYLYQNKVNAYLQQGYEEEESQALAATVVAVPGTSEHQLGLAMDIIDANYPYLTDSQADTGTQKWLMEHCAEYGFILRYPAESTDITGIIYEPWHYRYVGVEIAQEIQSQGITLEEYLGFTQE